MKTTIKKFLFFPILFSVLFFTSCQEEGIEITQGTDEEILAANSNVASLMKKTATKDGSYDNIIDRSSCFNVELPVNIFVNGLEIIVDSEEDFDVIESIFDEFYDDIDSIDFVFPITIVLADYTEITIENKEALENYINECSGENEEDDDIECVDFKFPISYSVFDTENNILNTVEIHSDREMYKFINNIDANDIISINFPISLIFTRGDVITVDSLSELEDALQSGAEFCDEDDNNDYGDDDFTKERLDALLVICPWIVHDVRRSDNNLTDMYREYLMIFKEDGTVKVRARNGDLITGTWSTRVSDRGAMIKLEFDSFVDFTLEWFVHDIDHGKIKLVTEGGNRIVLEKNCDVNFNHPIQRVKNILKECIWRVTRLNIDGIDNERKYIGTPLNFMNDNVVKLRINGELVMGTWDILETNVGLALQMSFDNRPHLNLYWLITVLEDDKVKLENQNSELILRRFCENKDDDVNYINDIILTYEWEVAYIEVNGYIMTDIYIDYVLNFKESGRVNVFKDNQEFSGSWLAYRNEGLKLGLNFGDNDPFFELNNRWKIDEITPNHIVLIDYSSTGSIERKLVLEKVN